MADASSSDKYSKPKDFKIEIPDDGSTDQDSNWNQDSGQDMPDGIKIPNAVNSRASLRNPDNRLRRKSGELQAGDFDRSVEREREFRDALSGEIGFPEEDGASRDEATLGIPRLNVSKKAGVPRLLIGGILGLLLIAAAVIGLNKYVFQKVPTPIPGVPAPSGPQAGTTMAWVDGSTLGFIPDPNGQDNNGQKGFWITLSPITYYQYSLCAQGGFCLEIPDENTTQVRTVETPLDFIQSHAGDSGNTDSDPATKYCTWMKGRVPTDAELASFKSFSASFTGGSETGIQDDTVRNGAAGIQDDTVHNGAAGIQDDTVHKVFCVVDHPLPSPQFARSSPYYDPSQPMEDMTPKVLKSEQFCQTNQGFQTLDLELDEDASIMSVNGDGHTTCQLVSGNRVVCFGDPNTNPQATVGIQCDSGQNLLCPIGSEFDGVSCSNNMHGGPIAGMDDWELDANGVLVPVNGVQPPGIHTADSQDQNPSLLIRQLPNGALLGPVMHNMIVINGVMVAMSLPGNDSSGNDLSMPKITMDSTTGNARLEPGTISCPSGYYLDENLQGCASLGAPEPDCLDGYHFNSDTSTCESDQPNGNYPGCPAGQLLNPLTNLCDSKSKMLSPTSVLMYEPLQISLPDCTKNGTQDQGGSSGPVPYCNPITSVCP